MSAGISGLRGVYICGYLYDSVSVLVREAFTGIRENTLKATVNVTPRRVRESVGNMLPSYFLLYFDTIGNDITSNILTDL